MVTAAYERPVYECVKPSDGSWKNRHRNARVTPPALDSPPNLSAARPITGPFDPRFYDLVGKLPEPTNEELMSTISGSMIEKTPKTPPQKPDDSANIAKYGWLGDDPRW